MNQPAPYYTAAQIARALGRQRQAVARDLASAPASGQSVVCGQPVNAWSIATLPAALQTALDQAAQRRGVRNAETLLASPVALWQSPVALSDVAQGALAAAVKLQRALARTLARQDDPALSAAQLEAIGLDDYAREFGHTITARHLRGMVSRTLERDGGAMNFDRLEIYLPDKPALKVASKAAIPLETQSDFRQLLEAIRAFQNPAAPSLDEKSYLWLLAFESYEEKLADARKPKKLKRALLQFLERNAPFLVSPDCQSLSNALRCAFQNKYARWLESERDAKALADGRAENSGRWRCPELPQGDRDKLIAHAVTNCGGRVAQAWREMVERAELSEAILGYYLSNPSRKSYVPGKILESVKYEIAMMEDIHHGPRQHKLNGAHLSRDWSTVQSLDWWQADDVTLPVYYYVPDGDGWFSLMRGQVLLMIDLRTTRILGFVLISERNYNANAIRTLITKVANQYGLPRQGFYFEQGTWKAKIIKGDVNGGALSWGETELGLREFGLRFVHARLPRAKPVEGIMNAAQSLMEGLPGYVGRNEQTEKFERVQKNIRAVNARKLRPEGLFLSEDEWSDVLTQLCAQFNGARQDGKMTGGMSPDEAFEQFANLSDPPVKFSPSCRYLLAHHKRPVNVTSNGITLRFGRQVYNYRNADTGALRGQTVLAWFDPENPDTLTVTDMNRKNSFCVSRSQDVPAMDAPAEIMAQEIERIAQHQAHAKARYKILLPLKPLTFRPMIADRATVELGAQIGARRNAVETEQRENARLETKGRKAANRLGVVVSQDKLRRPETAPALEHLADLLADESTGESTL